MSDFVTTNCSCGRLITVKKELAQNRFFCPDCNTPVDLQGASCRHKNRLGKVIILLLLAILVLTALCMWVIYAKKEVIDKNPVSVSAKEPSHNVVKSPVLLIKSIRKPTKTLYDRVGFEKMPEDVKSALRLSVYFYKAADAGKKTLRVTGVSPHQKVNCIVSALPQTYRRFFPKMQGAICRIGKKQGRLVSRSRSLNTAVYLLDSYNEFSLLTFSLNRVQTDTVFNPADFKQLLNHSCKNKDAIDPEALYYFFDVSKFRLSGALVFMGSALLAPNSHNSNYWSLPEGLDASPVNSFVLNSKGEFVGMVVNQVDTGKKKLAKASYVLACFKKMKPEYISFESPKRIIAEQVPVPIRKVADGKKSEKAYVVDDIVVANNAVLLVSKNDNTIKVIDSMHKTLVNVVDFNPSIIKDVTYDVIKQQVLVLLSEPNLVKYFDCRLAACKQEVPLDETAYYCCPLPENAIVYSTKNRTVYLKNDQAGNKFYLTANGCADFVVNRERNELYAVSRFVSQTNIAVFDLSTGIPVLLQRLNANIPKSYNSINSVDLNSASNLLLTNGVIWNLNNKKMPFYSFDLRKSNKSYRFIGDDQHVITDDMIININSNSKTPLGNFIKEQKLPAKSCYDYSKKILYCWSEQDDALKAYNIILE